MFSFFLRSLKRSTRLTKYVFTFGVCSATITGCPVISCNFTEDLLWETFSSHHRVELFSLSDYIESKLLKTYHRVLRYHSTHFWYGLSSKTADTKKTFTPDTKKAAIAYRIENETLYFYT